MITLICISKKYTKYGLQVKWGHKDDFGPICPRPDVTAGWHCVASARGWKVPALSIVRYINGSYSHNPSRAAVKLLQLSEGCSICAGLLRKSPATVNTCQGASRCHFLRTAGNLCLNEEAGGGSVGQRCSTWIYFTYMHQHNLFKGWTSLCIAFCFHSY